MAVNYNDRRFTQVKTEENKALQQANNTYNQMVNNSDKYYNDMIKAADDYGQQQQQLQQANTDFAIEKIEQQKDQAAKDYTREQKGAYSDWQKQSDQYGVRAEQIASMGLANSGYSESSQVNMYNTYQNRISQARDTYSRAVLEYDNGIKEAQLANNAKLAEIAYNALQNKLELGLNQFQYKNNLLTQQLQLQNDISDRYYKRWSDVLSQINTENALAEQIRQYNANLAEEKRQYNATMAENKRQFDAELALSKKKISSGGGKNRTYKITQGDHTYEVDEEGDVVGVDGKKVSTGTEVQGPSNKNALRPTGRGVDVLFTGKAKTWYKNNIGDKPLRADQLQAKLKEAQKSGALNDKQIGMIAKLYGVNFASPTTNKTIKKTTKTTKKTTKTNITTKGSSPNRKYDIRTMAKNSLSNRKR